MHPLKSSSYIQHGCHPLRYHCSFRRSHQQSPADAVQAAICAVHGELLAASVWSRRQLPCPHGELGSCKAQAHPRRVARVAKQIEREVGTLLLTDRVRSPPFREHDALLPRRYSAVLPTMCSGDCQQHASAVQDMRQWLRRTETNRSCMPQFPSRAPQKHSWRRLETCGTCRDCKPEHHAWQRCCKQCSRTQGSGTH